MKKDLLSCMDITRADFERIISLAAELKEGRGKPGAPKKRRHDLCKILHSDKSLV